MVILYYCIMMMVNSLDASVTGSVCSLFLTVSTMGSDARRGD